MAAMGGVWQALAFGFAGLRPVGSALRLDPRLPTEWRLLEITVRFLGSAVTIGIERDRVRVAANPPVAITLPGSPAPFAAVPAGIELVRRDHGWRRAP
jgi:trehalose/maltose hydrolase-like predicted phosphorylase